MRSMEGQPIYDISDVAKHNSAADAWIIINGKVLDITSWLAEHPGGEDVLLDLAGMLSGDTHSKTFAKQKKHNN